MDDGMIDQAVQMEYGRWYVESVRVFDTVIQRDTTHMETDITTTTPAARGVSLVDAY